MKRLWQKDAPIIGSMLEMDTYKFLMLYFIWRFFPDMKVKFTFTNRTKTVRLGEEIDLAELRAQIAHVQTLSFSEEQRQYLRTWGKFPEAFIQDLDTISLPDVLIRERPDGQVRIEVEGLWFHTTLWELFILPMMSEMRTRAFVGEDPAMHARVINDLEQRLLAKVPNLRAMQWMMLLFGLRRRASGDWERRFTEILLSEVPQRIAGVSNVAIAQETGIKAAGTIAHEVAMALGALRRHEGHEEIREAQYEVLMKWQQLFSGSDLVMLGDTFGSDQFFCNVPRQYAIDYVGPRQDSGDPFTFGEDIIAMYDRFGIDPLSKRVIFSDGLTVPKMQALEQRFAERVGGGFGWGTNGTCDTKYIQPISIVMKLVEAAGNPAIKLSDNLAKAIGDPDEVAVYKEIFGYDVTFDEQAVY